MPVPNAVVIDTLPDAPAPTVALILVGLCTVKVRAAVPPKLTAVAPVKLVPVMVTTCPVCPDVGVKEVMVGGMAAPIKVKPVIVPTPLALVTLTLPVAPAPITAVMEVALTTLYEVAAVPPKLTAEAPVKLVPVMVTV